MEKEPSLSGCHPLNMVIFDLSFSLTFGHRKQRLFTAREKEKKDFPVNDFFFFIYICFPLLAYLLAKLNFDSGSRKKDNDPSDKLRPDRFDCIKFAFYNEKETF